MNNYCDRCSAHAKVRVILDNGQDLMFCGHHSHVYNEKLSHYDIISLEEDESFHLATV